MTILEQIKQAETMGAAAYLLGALNAIEAFSKSRGNGNAVADDAPTSYEVVCDVDSGRPIGIACRARVPLDHDDDILDADYTENLKEIDDAVEAARGDKRFESRREMIVRRLWEPGARAAVYDRFATAIVLGFLTTTTADNILRAVDAKRAENPAFVAYPFVSNRLRSVFLANGYNYPAAIGALEPTPKVKESTVADDGSKIHTDKNGRVVICLN